MISDTLLSRYVDVATRMHGSAGEDVGDVVSRPDHEEKIGSYSGGDVYRVEDGWGEYYLAEPDKYVCCKMPDVMAVDVAPEYRGKIRYKELGMGDAKWDRAVVEALGGDMDAVEKIGWTDEARQAALEARRRKMGAEPQHNYDEKGRLEVVLSSKKGDRPGERKYFVGGHHVATMRSDNAGVNEGKIRIGSVGVKHVDYHKEGLSDLLNEDVKVGSPNLWRPGDDESKKPDLVHARYLKNEGSVRQRIMNDIERVSQRKSKPVVVKSAEFDFVNDLPDSAFAYIEPGGTKDESGRTTPRALRHLAFKNLDGEVDQTMLVAAIEGVAKAALPEVTKKRVADRLAKFVDEDERDESIAAQNPGGWPMMDPAWKSGDMTPEQLDAAYEEFKQKVIDAAKAAVGPGARVVTLRLDAAQFKTLPEASEWANDHGFRAKGVEREGAFVFAQEQHTDYDGMRSVELTQGVTADVGYAVKAIAAVQDAFLESAVAKTADLSAVSCEPVAESSDGLVIWRVAVGGSTQHYAQKGATAVYVHGYDALSKSLTPVVKSADEKRYTLTVVYPASQKGAMNPDFHGDVMVPDELEKSAWGFMTKGVDRIGLMHRPGTDGAGRIVESYIYRGPDWRIDKDMGGTPQVVKAGDWLMGIVWSPDSWQAIKSGQITGVSLQGAAHKVAFDE